MLKNYMHKILSAVLAASVSAAFLSALPENKTVLADDNGLTEYYCIGTSEILNPVVPENAADHWSGNYVYFGSYGGYAIKFRVLDPETSVYGGRTMLLDCDTNLFKMLFDDESNVWAESDVREYLNGEFYESSFSSIEQNAIFDSYLEGGIEYPSESYEGLLFEPSVGVDDKIFLLDINDVLNPDYGYFPDDGIELISDEWSLDSEIKTHLVTNHAKAGAYSYMLRAAGNDHKKWGGVYNSGILISSSDSYNYGVAPALNIDLSTVVVSYCESGTIGEPGAAFALHLEDKNLELSVQKDREVSASGSVISVPYSVGGKDAGKASAVSVMILDKKYTAGNTNGASLLYYDKLKGTFSTEGTGTFTLPSTLDINDWGSEYFVYILADYYGDNYTSFVSTPLPISIGGAQWHQDSHGWMYHDTYGSFIRSDWALIDGFWYYFNESCYMTTDWQKIGSCWYYFGGNGQMRTGWQKIGGDWYYLGGNGQMRTGWQKIDGVWYYFGGNGIMRTGWQYIGGYYYYFISDGTMAANEYREGYWLDTDGKWTYKYRAAWYKDSKGWYYQDTSGWYAKNATYKIDGKNYNFNSIGYCTNP